MDITTVTLLQKVSQLDSDLQNMAGLKVEVEADLETAHTEIKLLVSEIRESYKDVNKLDKELVDTRGRWTDSINEKAKLKTEIDRLTNETLSLKESLRESTLAGCKEDDEAIKEIEKLEAENEIVYKSIGSLQKEMSSLRWELMESNQREKYANRQWSIASQDAVNLGMANSELRKQVALLQEQAK